MITRLAQSTDHRGLITPFKHNLKLVSCKDKEKPEDLTKYMVYGYGCDNKSKLLESEPELKAEMNYRTNESDWTGRIIGYKLVPLYESKKEVRLLSLFKKTKISKIKTRRKNK